MRYLSSLTSSHCRSIVRFRLVVAVSTRGLDSYNLSKYNFAMMYTANGLTPYKRWECFLKEQISGILKRNNAAVKPRVDVTYSAPVNRKNELRAWRGLEHWLDTLGWNDIVRPSMRSSARYVALS